MNIKEAKMEIIHTIQAYTMKNEQNGYQIPLVRQRPILLIGPPGIGKTAIMEQIAEECDIGLVAYTITHHTRQSAIGLPLIEKKVFDGKEYTVTEYTMSEIVGSIYEYEERTGHREGILFIDEINCVSETLAPTMLQFLQYKTFGNHHVPEGWVIVAAGNPPEYNKSVRELDMAALDRVRTLHVEAEVSVWKNYALKKGIHPAILSYLELHPEYFYQVTLTRDKQEFVTARGWEDLSVLLWEYERQGYPIDRNFMEEFLRVPKIASDFASYYQLSKTYLKEYHLSELTKGTLETEKKEELQNCLLEAPGDVRCMFIRHLLSAVSEQMTDYGMFRRMTEREKEVLCQLSSYLKGEGKGSPDGFFERRFHAREVQKENDLLKPWEERLECAVDEALKELLTKEGRTQVLRELTACTQVDEVSVPSANLLKKQEELTAKREEVVECLDRLTGFLLETFGEDLEVADWLHGVQSHGDYQSLGYQRNDLKALLTGQEQEERLRKNIREMEEMYETFNSK